MNSLDAPIAFDADSSARSAALLLHALADADRRWLLEQLSPEDGAKLHPMLAELRDMGVPPDRALVHGVLRAPSFLDVPDSGDVDHFAPTRGRDPVGGETDEALIARLSRASAIALAEVLRSEPPRLIARLLLVADWPWREPVLARLGPAIRSRVESAVIDLRDEIAHVRAASALKASLLAQVSAGLDSFMASKQWAALAPKGWPLDRSIERDRRAATTLQRLLRWPARLARGLQR